MLSALLCLVAAAPLVTQTDLKGVSEAEARSVLDVVESEARDRLGPGQHLEIALSRQGWKIEVAMTLLSGATRESTVRVPLTRKQSAWPALIGSAMSRLVKDAPPPQTEKRPRRARRSRPPRRAALHPNEAPPAADNGPGAGTWIVLGGSAILAGVGTYFAIQTADTLSGLPIPAPGQPLTSATAAELKEGQESAFKTGIAANVLLSVGAAGLISSLVLLMSGA